MKQYFEAPISEIIKNRHSVRTYKSEALDKKLIEKLREYSDEITGPFNSKVRMVLLDGDEHLGNTGGKIGTYGVIKGAKSFIAGVADNSKNSIEQLGYCLEKLILYAASLGLGTCWLGGTFKRSQFAELTALKKDEFIPAVTPIGYPADKRTFLDSTMRRIAGSDNRRPWKELFFDGSFDKPLAKEVAGQYADALEMVRLAPSASNKQPWRVLKDEAGYHFYLNPSKGYSDALGFNIQKVDIGIAMCHFEMAAAEAELKGNWIIKPQLPQNSDVQNVEYIVSWIIQ